MNDADQADVGSFAAELREVLELILGARPPEPEPGLDPLLVTRQWLAERNLGLVPVDSAAGFDWPGHWIAQVRSGGGRSLRRFPPGKGNGHRRCLTASQDRRENYMVRP